MSVTYRDTYLRSADGAYVRSPAGAKVRSLPSAISILTYYIRGAKAYWGFPGYNNVLSNAIPVYTTNTVAPSVQIASSPNTYLAGTDDIGVAPYFGSSTNTINGYDINGSGDLWNGAVPLFISPITTTQTTETGIVKDYLNNNNTVTATLSNYRDVGYSYAQSLASTGLWTNSLLAGGNNAMIQTLDEILPNGVFTNIPIPHYSPYFLGTGTGNPNGYTTDIFSGYSYLMNNILGGNNPCSGWYLYGQQPPAGAGHLFNGNFYVQRGGFQNTSTVPLYYFFAEVYATYSYNVGISFTHQVHYIGPGGILKNDGTLIEIPQPTAGPSDMSFSTGYVERLVVVVINQSIEQFAASLGATII